MVEDKGIPATMIFTRGVVGTPPKTRPPITLRSYTEAQKIKCREIESKIDVLTYDLSHGRRLEPLHMSKDELIELVELQRELMFNKCNCLEKVI
jgi:hypothetical protein